MDSMRRATLTGQEINIIRTETALSRYPIHNLSTSDGAGIEIRRTNEKGALTLYWKVSYNPDFGEAGRLAYKLDTWVVNQRIDEAMWGNNPVPKILKLGSLHEIAQELGLGGDTNKVKKALRQNASTFIVTHLNYKASDGTERTLEADFTRYSIIFLGQQLPDGRKADAVYLLLNEIYMEVLNSAVRRPLDYDYIRELSPIEQRFYEILSYEIYPAIKYNQRAKLAYSEYCLYSTAKRNFEYDKVKKQMYNVHRPHLAKGYLAKVEFEPTTDSEGKPDWNMFYTPGERARFQQLLLFNLPAARRERAQRTLPAHVSKPSPEPVSPPQLPLLPEKERGLSEKKLVETFYRVRYGQEQTPTDRELGQAGELLSLGMERAEHLVTFAARQGKEGGGFPNDFGGVKKLAAQAKEEFDVKYRAVMQTQLQKARQSHEKAHSGAYREYLKGLLRGGLESGLPEAFAAFKADEERLVVFHRARAARSERSAQFVAEFYDEENQISRLLSFIKEKPEVGLPTFWQWDENINPRKFNSENGQ